MKKMLCLLLVLMTLIPCVCIAEEESDPWALPMDFTFPNYQPDPNGFTDMSYHDDTLDITVEMTSWQGTKFYIARVKVASPTQLRTAIAGKPNVSSKELPSIMGRKMNAVLTINGEYYTQRTQDIFIYRQGFMFRNDPDRVKDVLIIDSKGDFHIFTSENKKQEIQEFLDAGNVVYQAFSFGPALIANGERVKYRKEYYFYPEDRTWRTFIAQDGPLSYVCVISEGSTHRELAAFAETLNLQAAYNLDGGQSSVMIFNNKYVGNRKKDTEREQSDIIYFVTAIPNE